jgi:hypothetical protein
MLERAGHVPDVGRSAEQVTIGLQYIDHGRSEGWPDHHLNALDLVGPRSADGRLEHRLQRRRRRVVDD